MIEIFVENLHARHGKWFELPIRFEEIEETLALKDGQEYLISDYMAPFTISNYESFSYMNEVAEQLDEHTHDPAINYLGELVDNGFFSDLLDAFEKIDEIHVYTDCFSYEDYAEYFIEECGYLSGVPDIIKWHVDYKGIGLDLSHDGNLYQADDQIIIEVSY
ncbi:MULTISPECIES: antirestriction protein ArdA [Listeria]|uniref:antirestriction protein ArdA n=1 Tax=Listeria TaxID=1637 RepID=UPI000F1EF271|nr:MULTISPECIES: antirestriction protein ArdA [Listeria]EAE7308543.1 antirestriction protein ArdA [Listeria monocytogenes]EAF9641513.1 antirestriction protein ArdA [Listeria monocytogenes]EAG4503467.1 antirestriction protein ArdA [Listeria monocytogenes]EHD1395542.1 antirestriction protein ArdA [Listeria monocytogenes]MBC1924645.1 antirestriction protein ArdA [Listeria innocua]